MYELISKALRKKAIKEKAAFFPRFFKTGKGQYGEGDLFIGIIVPELRAIAKKYFKETDKQTIIQLLDSAFHEERATGLFILNLKFLHDRKYGQEKQWVDLYLKKINRVNNWDLVDNSAYIVLGNWLLDKDRAILYKYAKSKDLWLNRIAIITTFQFIKSGDLVDALNIADILLQHPHDLIHKAVGWMLREAWKRNNKQIENFLDQHASYMPRTMLRYAIEKMDVQKKTVYMKMKKANI